MSSHSTRVYTISIYLCIMICISAENACNTDHQYFDHNRQTCLDLCGDNKCTIDYYCSEKIEWSQEIYQVPTCVYRCSKPCDQYHFCNHTTAECDPCYNLCKRGMTANCRKFCYDKYIRVVNVLNSISSQDKITMEPHRILVMRDSTVIFDCYPRIA